MSEREVVDEFARKRAPLCRVENEAAEERSVLVDQRRAIDVELKSEILRLDAKRKELLRQLKEERQRVLSELKQRRNKLSRQIQGATMRQQAARRKIQQLREARDRRLAKLKARHQEADEEEDADADADEEEDNERVSVDEEWKRRVASFRAIDKDFDVNLAQRKAVTRAFQELVDLRVVAPPSYNNKEDDVALEAPVKSLDDLLGAIRADRVADVVDKIELLKTSTMEEQAARDSNSDDSMLRLPGVRALIAALTSPDCSWRTLKLLVEWGRASGHADIYNVREMERYWLAGFQGLVWPDSSVRMPEFLPHSYTPEARMGKKQLTRNWDVDVLVPIIDVDSRIADTPEELVPRAYQSRIDDTLRRLVNQASKLFAVCKGLVSGVYHCALVNRPVGWALEERRGQFRRKNVELTDTEVETVRRVVRTCWRLE